MTSTPRNRWTLELELRGHGPSVRSVEFDATSTARDGHFVVPSASPIADLDSVFVIQVSEVD